MKPINILYHSGSFMMCQIGKYARIEANSVVLNDIEAFGVAVGLPVKTISIRADKKELVA